MKTGKDLGEAILKAIESLGWKQADAARKWNVKPPSVSDWVRTGRIHTDKLLELMDLASDHLGPDHWGLYKWPGSREKNQEQHEACKTIESDKESSFIYYEHRFDPITKEVVKIMKATDQTGRIMALGAVKVALHGYHPAEQKRAG